ncbi:hypothetical protein RvY_13876 [Ramazzottius varieornatus]|uniref:FERM domain-containing protein n=1 Tax=Ramazzottius varieornatus TaxID=947166 RepID=A0A1D1VRI3_RAMVA|nr:hypothetical protein RvY_13876 [Ramazzottius varieornatus]
MTVARMRLWGHDLLKTYHCTIRFLDESSWQTTYTKGEESQKLFDRVCAHLNLMEKDYFGLRFVDEKKQRKWLDLSKNARKQLRKAGKDADNVIISFRVKFYPPDPVKRLNEELTRYQIYLQLRRDLQHGRLYGSSGEEAYLLACILQSELKDMPARTISLPENYRSLQKHGKKGEGKTLDQWKAMRGASYLECEERFLEKAATLDTFGIDPHPTQNELREQVFLGYNHFGIIAFQGAKKAIHINWAHMIKMSFEGKQFLLYYTKDSKRITKGFTCGTKSAAKHLWRNAFETKVFFTAPSSENLGHIGFKTNLFSRASKIRFSGRVAREVEISTQYQLPNRSDVTVSRVAFGQTRPESVDVYEGVVATPALRRRPSLYPVGKETKEPAAETDIGRSRTMSDTHAPSTVSTPEHVAIPLPNGPSFLEMANSPSPASALPDQVETVQSTISSVENIPASSPLSHEKILDDTWQRIEEILQQPADETQYSLPSSVFHRESNGYIPEEPSLADDELRVLPPQHPLDIRNVVGGNLAMKALLVGTAVVGMYAVFSTNWLPTAFIDLLRTSLFVPIAQLFVGGTSQPEDNTTFSTANLSSDLNTS